MLISRSSVAHQLLRSQLLSVFRLFFFLKNLLFRYCLSCQQTLYYPLYKVSEVKRNYNLRKDDDVPPTAFLVVENLMFEVNQCKITYRVRFCLQLLMLVYFNRYFVNKNLVSPRNWTWTQLGKCTPREIGTVNFTLFTIGHR